MNKKGKILALIFIFCFSISLLAACGGSDDKEVFRVYFGLNDADTGTQIVTIKNAQPVIRNACIDAGIGYTEYVAEGAYIDGDEIKKNGTLVFEFFFTDRKTVETIIDSVRKELNLASVLIVELNCSYDFA